MPVEWSRSVSWVLASGGGYIPWSEWEVLQSDSGSSYMPYRNVGVFSAPSPLQSHPKERIFAAQSDADLQWIFSCGTARSALSQSHLSGDFQ